MAAIDGWFGRGDATADLRATGSVRRWWGSFRRTGGFKMVQLNVVGWAALIGPGVAVGGITAAAALKRPWWQGALSGAAATWLLALTIDHWAYRRSDIHFVLDVAGADEVRRVVDDLRAGGLDVTAAQEPDLATDVEGAPPWVLHGMRRDRRAIERRIWRAV